MEFYDIFCGSETESIYSFTWSFIHCFLLLWSFIFFFCISLTWLTYSYDGGRLWPVCRHLVAARGRTVCGLSHSSVFRWWQHPASWSLHLCHRTQPHNYWPWKTHQPWHADHLWSEIKLWFQYFLFPKLSGTPILLSCHIFISEAYPCSFS